MKSESGRLLTAGIGSMAAQEHKTAECVEEELATTIGVSRATIQRYKAGTIPSERRTVELLAEACVKRGNMNREWLQRFLQTVRYLAPDDLIQRLYPEAAHGVRPDRIYQNIPSPTYSQFVMRKEPFDAILHALRQRLAVVLIYGFGGIGKSSLALEFARFCLQDGDDHTRFSAAVWISDQGREGTTTLSRVLDEIAYTLGYRSFTQCKHEEKKYEVGQLLRHYRVLLIVDNFETITDQALQEWLLQIPEPSKAIVTTRELSRSWWSSWPIHVEKMTDAEADQLIAERVQVLGIPRVVNNAEQLGHFLELTEGNPKAITISLGLHKYEHRPFQDIIDDLRAAQGELFDNLFTRAWGLLDEAARRVLLLASLFVDGASDEALAATAMVPDQELAHAIETLTDLSLLDIHQGKELENTRRYTLHSLVRLFANRRMREQPGFEADARARWCGYYLDFVTHHSRRRRISDRYWNALATLHCIEYVDLEWGNLQSVLEWVEQQSHHQLLVELMMHLVHYMDRRGLYIERVTYVQRAAAAAEALGQIHDAALFRIDGLGWTLAVEGRFDEAEQEINTGLAHAQTLGNASADGRDLTALAYSHLARVHLGRGDIPTALEWITSAQQVDCRPIIRTRVALTAGEIEHVRGNYHAAIAFYQENILLNNQFPCDDEHPGFDELHYRIGFTYLAQGAIAEARNAFTTVLEGDPRDGTTEYIHATFGMACVAKAEGDHETAYRLAHEARDRLLRLRIRHQLINEIEAFLEESVSHLSD